MKLLLNLNLEINLLIKTYYKCFFLYKLTAMKPTTLTHSNFLLKLQEIYNMKNEERETFEM